jgi:hypothetical protein
MNQSRLLSLIIVAVLALLACGDEAASASRLDSGADGETGDETDASATIDAAQKDGAGQASYQGFEERYILTGDDDPVDVCRVRYELHAVGEPSLACAECRWDALIERRNPSIIVDVDNACANSDLALDAAGIAAFESEQLEYGFVYEYVGHSNVLVRLNRDRGTWEAVTFANWNEATGDFYYDRRDGFCSYGGDGPTFENQGICGLKGEAVVSE